MKFLNEIDGAKRVKQDSNNRFVTDTEKGRWNGKWKYNESTIKAVKVSNAENADTVNGKTVAANVPAGAKFTDTVYSHPATHPASMITGLPTSIKTITSAAEPSLETGDQWHKEI